MVKSGCSCPFTFILVQYQDILVNSNQSELKVRLKSCMFSIIRNLINQFSTNFCVKSKLQELRGHKLVPVMSRKLEFFQFTTNCTQLSLHNLEEILRQVGNIDTVQYPENSKIKKLLLESNYNFKKFSLHETQQLCTVNKPITHNF